MLPSAKSTVQIYYFFSSKTSPNIWFWPEGAYKTFSAEKIVATETFKAVPKHES